MLVRHKQHRLLLRPSIHSRSHHIICDKIKFKYYNALFTPYDFDSGKTPKISPLYLACNKMPKQESIIQPKKAFNKIIHKYKK